jgi:uncharacterized membrane protein YhfC
MLDNFDNYLRSIGYGGMFALAMLTAVCLSVVIIGAIFWFSRAPRRNSGG